MTEHPHHEHISARAALQLMAPHTWVAAIAPVLLGVALAFGLGGFSAEPTTSQVIIVTHLMLITSIALQSAVNTFNDYSDFVSGADTAENVVDETDSSIIYNRLDPKAVLRFALILLAIAFITGMILVMMSSWKLLILGLLGAAAVMLYSFGPKPIAYLPLGELVSGLVMGGIITVGTYLALTKQFDPWIFAYALPVIIGVGIIMQINNTCDIEKDIEAGRKTLPILLGKELSVQMIVWSSFLSLVIIALIGGVHFRAGLIAFALFAYPLIKNLAFLARDPYSIESRSTVMKVGAKQVALSIALLIAVVLLSILYSRMGNTYVI